MLKWNGPRDSILSAKIIEGRVSIYLADEEDRWLVQDVPIDEFKVWASTVLAEIARAGL
jgi:hypothetical protein